MGQYNYCSCLDNKRQCGHKFLQIGKSLYYKCAWHGKSKAAKQEHAAISTVHT